ncbi:MAG: hypothetical protein U9R04_02305 [Chloroflexota bacterium]|nr:hypothetical protein [Chloroflexota bacterium]
MLKRIVYELGRHAPFTFTGALLGVAIMLAIIWGNFLPHVAPFSQDIFYVLHPLHVVLSALVTTALYLKYGKRRIWLVILIGYTGSVGIATISDCLIPYLGESLLALPDRGIHIGFIEKWWLVNPAAFLGIALGYWKRITKFPHYGHVLISTWASLFHVIMALGTTVNWIQIIIILLFLFLAVWIPCCTSDIVYPLLFTRKRQLQEAAS